MYRAKLISIFIAFLFFSEKGNTQNNFDKVSLHTIKIYNEGTAPETIRTGLGNVKIYNWSKKSNNTEKVVYRLNLALMGGAADQQYDIDHITKTFGLVYLPSGINPPDKLEFALPGDDDQEVVAEFKYVQELQQGFYNFYPYLTFYKKDLGSIKGYIEGKRACINSKVQIKLTGEFGPAFKPKSIAVNGKDLTARYDTDGGFNALIDDATGPLKFSLTDINGYVINYNLAVLPNDEFSRCPSIKITQVKGLNTLKKDNSPGGYEKIVELRGTVSPVDYSNFKNQNTNGYDSIYKKSTNEAGFVIYASPSQLAAGIQLTDEINTIKILPSLLSPADNAKLNAGSSPVGAFIKIKERSVVLPMSDGNIFRLVAEDGNSFWNRLSDISLTIMPDPSFDVKDIEIDGVPLRGRTFSLSEEKNGVPINFVLYDRAGNTASFPAVFLIKSELNRIPPAASLVHDSSYGRYFKNIQHQKGSFLAIQENKLHFLDNTTIDLKEEFSMVFKPNLGSPRPAIVFGSKPEADYYRIRFAGDVASFEQVHNDGTVVLIDTLSLGGAVAGSVIKLERRNRYLDENFTERRDLLFLNDRYFKNVSLTDKMIAGNSKIGFDFSSSTPIAFKFDELTLSKHIFKVAEDQMRPGYTDQTLLNNHFTGSLENFVLDKSVFEAATLKSYAILIANSEFEKDPLTGEQQLPLQAAIVMDSLKQVLCEKYQFDSSRVLVLRNVSKDRIELLFDQLSNSTYFKNLFGIDQSVNIDLSTLQLMIGLVSHGKASGEVIMSNGRDIDMKQLLKKLINTSQGEANFVYQSFLYVEDVCYGSFFNGVNCRPVTSTIGSSEKLDRLYEEKMIEADPVVPSFHAANYNAGNLSLNIAFMRKFTNTLATRGPANYYTDFDIVLECRLSGTAQPILLKPLIAEGNGRQEDGRFLFLPREKYKHL